MALQRMVVLQIHPHPVVLPRVYISGMADQLAADRLWAAMLREHGAVLDNIWQAHDAMGRRFIRMQATVMEAAPRHAVSVFGADGVIQIFLFADVANAHRFRERFSDVPHVAVSGIRVIHQPADPPPSDLPEPDLGPLFIPDGICPRCGEQPLPDDVEDPRLCRPCERLGRSPRPRLDRGDGARGFRGL